MSAATTLKVRKILADVIGGSHHERENVYDMSKKRSTGRAELIGHIIYITADDMSQYDEAAYRANRHSNYGDYIVVLRDLDDGYSATSLGNKKKAVFKAVDFDETPRDYGLTLFAASFGITNPISTNEFGS